MQRELQLAGDRVEELGRLSILSQLQRDLVKGVEHLETYDGFQFFPSCSLVDWREGGGGRGLAAFNSFPVAATRKYPRIIAFATETFNSFPVAAEAPAARLLINLSSANFEVLENSPAPLSDTCSVSRKPFPDSRRKEGIWTERNVV